MTTIPSGAIERIDWSALSMYLRCGQQYYLRHVKNIPAPPEIALIVDAGYRRGIEYLMREKVKTHNIPPLSVIADATRDGTIKGFAAGFRIVDENEKGKSPDILQAGAVDKAVQLVRTYYFNLAHKVEPLEDSNIFRKSGIVVRGKSCLVEVQTDIREPNDSGVTLRDSRVASKIPPESEADKSDHLTMSALAEYVSTKILPKKVVMDTAVYLGKGGVKIITLESNRTPEDLMVMLRRIEAAVNGIRQGVFLPSSQTHWWCSKKWCGYAQQCPYFRMLTTVKMGGVCPTEMGKPSRWNVPLADVYSPDDVPQPLGDGAPHITPKKVRIGDHFEWLKWIYQSVKTAISEQKEKK